MKFAYHKPMNKIIPVMDIVMSLRMRYPWLISFVWVVSVFKYLHSGDLVMPRHRGDSREPQVRVLKDDQWYHLLCPRYRLRNMSEPMQIEWHPPDEETIIFTQTSCGLDFNGRQACAVESAARHHRRRPVTVFVTAPFIDKSHPLIKILSKLDNVHFSYLDLDDLFSDSPLQSWFQERLWLINEEHQSAFISDASRGEILRKYGGTYMDLDALTLRPLPNRKNYLGRLDAKRITGAIISLVKGHPLSQTLSSSIPEAFKPFKIDSIGPALVDSVLRKLCPGNLTQSRHTPHLSNASRHEAVLEFLEDVSPYFQTPEICSDLTVYPEKLFYPIGFQHYSGERFLLFKSGFGYGEKFLKVSKAYSLHLYSSLTWTENVMLGGDSILEEVVKKNCPSVYHGLKNRVSFF